MDSGGPKAEEQEEEEDYMSDAFLERCQTKPTSIAGSRADIRRNQLEAKKKICDSQSRKLNKEEMELANRESGLSTALPPSNKGFALLAKMGYKEGMGIGKTGAGRTEPIPVEVKEPRTGLGHEGRLKRRKQAAQMFQRLAEKRKRLENDLVEDYHNRKRSRNSLKSMLRDIEQSRRICYELDSRNNKSSPDRWWFWPDDALPEDDPNVEYDTADDELTLADSLCVLTYYLRRQYFYCTWCGTNFIDNEDLLASCPGSSAEDHEADLDNSL